MELASVVVSEDGLEQMGERVVCEIPTYVPQPDFVTKSPYRLVFLQGPTVAEIGDGLVDCLQALDRSLLYVL